MLKSKALLLLIALCLNTLSFSLLANDQQQRQADLIKEILDLSRTPSENIPKHYTPNTWLLELPNWFESHFIYGHRHIPNTTVRSILRHKNQIIWDKTYHTDDWGNRAMPSSYQFSAKKPSITLMGCSFIIGPGLADDETIMYNLGQLLPQYNIRNISTVGGGPHMTLAQLQTLGEEYISADQEDIFIFNFSESEHLGRANGFMLELGWLDKSPYYERVDTSQGVRMVSNGSFLEARPLMTKLLNYLRTHFFSTQSDYHIPPIMDYHRDNLCLMFKEMKLTIKKHNPKAQFFVLYYPMSHGINDYYPECFKKYDLNELRPTHIPGTVGLTTHPHDFHPNIRGARQIAKAIYGELKQQGALKK